MAINDISLTSGMRSNLSSLQGTVELLNRTQERLSTGKKVNSAIDNPSAYFAAQNLNSRAATIDATKDGMGQAIQTIKAADAGIKAISGLIEQAKGIASQAASGYTATLGAAYTAILAQIDSAAGASGYNVNLLGGASMTVAFDSGSMVVTGFSASSSGLSITAAVTSTATATTALGTLATASDTLKTQAASMSANLGVISIRQEFATKMISVLSEGADKLTLADTNEEGANMLMLQTRQSLATTALSMSAQAAQSVLRLFG